MVPAGFVDFMCAAARKDARLEKPGPADYAGPGRNV
jgi:hypothetical protein